MLLKEVHPRAYQAHFLANDNLRPDGRTALSLSSGSNDEAWPATSLTPNPISHAAASVLVRLGATSLVVALSLSTFKPSAAAPTDGQIVPNVELPPACAPNRFAKGPPEQEAMRLTHEVNEVIVASELLPLSTLCIQPGAAAFLLSVDIICLSYDASILDACVLGVTYVLSALRLPKADWDEDTLSVLCSPPPPSARSLVTHNPLTATFALTTFLPPPTASTTSAANQEELRILPCPSSFETDLAPSVVSISLSATSSTIYRLSQYGAPVGGTEVLKRCVKLARERAKVLEGVLAEALETGRA